MTDATPPGPFPLECDERPPHFCELMERNLEDPLTPLVYDDVVREYSMPIVGQPAFQTIWICPWCAEALPESLRVEWVEALERLGLEPGDAAIPARLLSGAWWREQPEIVAQQRMRPSRVLRLW